MKLDKEKIEAITKLPDSEMWCEVRRIASEYGFKLPEKTPTHEELDKLRRIASSGKIGPIEAIKLMNELKRREKNG